MNFVKVPKQIIFYKDLGSKRIGTYIYFSQNIALNDNVNFSKKDIIDFLGYKSNRHKGGVDDQIYTLLYKLQELDYIKIIKDSSYDKLSKALINTDKFYPDNNFAYITYDEIDKILNYKDYVIETSRITSCDLLLCLCCIRSGILRRNEYEIIENKPEFFYGYYNRLSDLVGISSRQFSISIEILNKLDILYFENLPRYQDKDGKWHTRVTVFADKYKYGKGGKEIKDYNYKEEIEYGKKVLIGEIKLKYKNG